MWAVDGKPKTGNPADYHQRNGETIAIGFLPEGVDLEFPPDACSAFDNISDDPSLAGVLSPASPCNDQSSTSSTAPAATTTTATGSP